MFLSSPKGNNLCLLSLIFNLSVQPVLLAPFFFFFYHYCLSLYSLLWNVGCYQLNTAPEISFSFLSRYQNLGKYSITRVSSHGKFLGFHDTWGGNTQCGECGNKRETAIAVNRNHGAIIVHFTLSFHSLMSRACFRQKRSCKTL